jgi:hypothetical protein
MSLQKGEVYRCPDPECGCEIQVTHGPNQKRGDEEELRCCCGQIMQKAS